MSGLVSILGAKKQTAELAPMLRWSSVATGAALVGIGIGGLVAPKPSSKMYGVPILSNGSAGAAYLRAVAVRDISLGGIFLAFAGLRDRRALGTAFLLTAAVAAGDGSVALRYSRTPARVLPIHWGSAAGLLAAAYLLLRKNGKR